MQRVGRSEFVIRHFPRVGVVRAALPNGRSLIMWSRGDDWIPSQIYWRGWSGYEPETAEVFFRLAERSRVILDIGAHVGYYTLLAAHANPLGTVVALEPMSPIYERLRSNVERNGLRNVRCLAIAAGSRNETADFFSFEGLPFASSLSDRFTQSAGLPRSRTSVQVARLDDIVRQLGLATVDLVKIDVESSEPQVLEGMEDTIRLFHPAIVCEVLAGWDTGTRIKDILGRHGYRSFALTKDGPLETEALEGHSERNYLFTTGRP